jgi:hypothetical protein
MNRKNILKITVVLVAAIVVVGMSSCNRGYGCPYELKAAAKVVSCIR